MIALSPSLLAADFSNLSQEVEKVKNVAEFLHFDIMDGHFVPNIALGACVVQSLRKRSALLFDVHLMVEHPERYLDAFCDAGADLITFHLEATDDPGALIDAIHARGKKAGISLKPATPPDAVVPFLHVLDLVLVMTVEPGFGGQSLRTDCVEKLPFIRARIDDLDRPIWLEVDGGIDEKTAPLVAQNGADLLVAGSAIFGKKDPRQAAQLILDAAKKQKG